MHVQQHIKICIAKQAKDIYRYKTTKSKLYKINAAIWFNKTCRAKQLTPNYINIKVSGNNIKAERTRKSAIRHRINQELKFQYAKKQRINEQLYKIHLVCANNWPTTWQMIQAVMDNNIQTQMEKHYTNLNKKLDNLIKRDERKTT